MYGISRISCQQDVMLVTFPEADQGAGSMAAFLTAFSDAGVNMDMISQSIPKGAKADLSFTTSYENWALVMQTLPRVTAGKSGPAPLIGGGYSKLNLFGQEMEGMCGVAARVLAVLAGAKVGVELITTSSVDISLLVAAEDEDTALTALKEAFSL